MGGEIWKSSFREASSLSPPIVQPQMVLTNNAHLHSWAMLCGLRKNIMILRVLIDSK